MPSRHLLAIVALALLVALAAAAPARAGFYTVPGTCGQWTPWGAERHDLSRVPGPGRPQHGPSAAVRRT